MSIIFFRFFLLFSVVANRAGSKTQYHRACSRSLTIWVLSRSLRFAAKILYEIMLFRISMLYETVETRRPWRGSPRPCVHAGAFLCFVCIISTVSKQLLYSLTRKHSADASPPQAPAPSLGTLTFSFTPHYSCSIALIWTSFRCAVNQAQCIPLLFQEYLNNCFYNYI